MPARTDHDRRDAQHAARARITVAMSRYIRRMTEEAYAHIEQEATDHDGTGHVDWSAVGTIAANRALSSYGVAGGAPERAIEGDHAAIDSGDDQSCDPPRT